MNNLAFFYNVANFENVQLYTPTFNFSSFKQLNSLQCQWNGPERSNRLFTRSISECDFAVSQSLLQIIIIFVFWLMAQPNAKSDSRVNRPLNSNFIPTKNSQFISLIELCLRESHPKLLIQLCYRSGSKAVFARFVIVDISACLLQGWVGPDFFGHGSGSGFMIRARAFPGLKKLLNKSGLIRAWALLYI